MSSEYIDTVELDRLIRRKRRLWGCRLIRIEVRPGGLMEYAYHCSGVIAAKASSPISVRNPNHRGKKGDFRENIP
jgi:hypothetical protein